MMDSQICRRYQLLSFVDGVGLFCSQSMAQCDVCSASVDSFVANQFQAEASGDPPAAHCCPPNSSSPVLSGLTCQQGVPPPEPHPHPNFSPLPSCSTSQQAESGVMWNDGLHSLYDCFYPDDPAEGPSADLISISLQSPASPPFIFRKSQDGNRDSTCPDEGTWDNSFPTQYATLSALSCSPLQEVMRNAGKKRDGKTTFPASLGFNSFEYVDGKLTCSPFNGRNKKARPSVVPMTVEPFTTKDTVTIQRVTGIGETELRGDSFDQVSVDASPFLPRSLVFGNGEQQLSMNSRSTLPIQKKRANPYIIKLVNHPHPPPHLQGDNTCENMPFASQATSSSVFEARRSARQKVYSYVNQFCMKGILTPGTVHPCCGVCHVLLPAELVDFSSSLRHDARNCKFQNESVCTNCGNQMKQGSCGFNGKSFHCVSIPRRFTKGCCTTCCIPYNNRLPSPLHNNNGAMNQNCRKIDNTYFWKVVMTLFRERRSVLAMIVSNHIKDKFEVLTATQPSFGNWLVSDMLKKDTETNRTLATWYFWHKHYRRRKF